MRLDELLKKLDESGELNSISITAIAGGYEARVVLASKYQTPGSGRSADPTKAVLRAHQDAAMRPLPKKPRLRMKD